MGMLMHHTWLSQQKPEKPVKEEVTEKVEKETEETAPVKRTGGRPKKTSNK